MRFSRIIFWEPTVSPHKADLLHALAEATSGVCDILCVAQEGLLACRKEMGWVEPLVDNYKLMIAPENSLINDLTQPCDDVLHVFSGLRHVPCIVAALRRVKKYKLPFAVLSEPRVREGYRGLLRYVQSWLTEGWIRRNVSFVLAIGRNGPPWFKSVGYSEDKIYPFAYFINASTPAKFEGHAGVAVAYVGRITSTKGVRTLFEAMLLLRDVRLIVIGAGELDEELKAFSNQHNLDVIFYGVRKISEIPSILANVDVLVLPAITKDGWGVVVSEALLAGTAAIATDCVGASILLDDCEMGRVVPKNDAIAVVRAIKDMAVSGGFLPHSRNNRAKKAHSMLIGVAGADYFLQILRHVFESGERPTPFYEVNRV